MPKATRFAQQPRFVLPGSEKAPVTQLLPAVAGSVAKAPSGKVTATVYLRAKKAYDPMRRMTRSEFASTYGAEQASLKIARAFAKEYGLSIVSLPAKGRCELVLSGSAAQMQKAFGVTLAKHEIEGKAFRVRAGAIMLPQELEGHVTAVLGLDNRPQAVSHRRVAKPRASNVSYTPVEVGALYGIPAGASAAGQTIGIVELGGGFRKADLTAYFKTLGIKAPTVTAVSVDSGKNAPTTASSADGEVMLDIEVCAAVAAGAKIAVYFAPNTDQGFTDAIAQAVHDTTNKPSVISISWGAPESSWTAQAMAALDAAAQAAAMLGVTITVASGDNGSSDGATGNNVDFPASSPHVLGCGGTKLIGAGTSITSEVVWNETAANEGATGGGVSNVFSLPTWQVNSNVPKPSNAAGGRGVPDVSGNADPATGYQIRVDGQSSVIGGTSTVAPLWAAVIALANAQNKNTAGFVNPALYAAAGACNDITSGNNGAFQAAAGWDACTGLGSPRAASIFQTLASAVKVKKPKKGAKAKGEKAGKKSKA